jgi:hypothetical protein
MCNAREQGQAATPLHLALYCGMLFAQPLSDQALISNDAEQTARTPAQTGKE